jgi:hypothetical protein
MVSLGFYKEKLGLKNKLKSGAHPSLTSPSFSFFQTGLLFLFVFPSWPNGDKLCLSFPLVCKKILGIAFHKKEKLFLPIFVLSFWLTENFISLKIAAAE